MFATAKELKSCDKEPALILCLIFRRVEEPFLLSAASQFGFKLVDKWPTRIPSQSIVGSWFQDDEDQPNTKRNHTNDQLEVPIGPITRARTKKLKEALNELVQNIWSKMDLEGLGTFKEHEGQPLIHLIQVQEEPNSCGTSG